MPHTGFEDRGRRQPTKRFQGETTTVPPDELAPEGGPWATRGPAAAPVHPLEGSIAVVSWFLQKAIAAER